jgi:hypothetical protein
VRIRFVKSCAGDFDVQYNSYNSGLLDFLCGGMNITRYLANTENEVDNGLS